jgi:hypothetical protein
MENLTLASRDTSAYNEATCTLRSLPSYQKLVDIINEQDITKQAMTVIQILLNEGLASPASTCWASDTAILSPDRLLIDSLLSTYHLCIYNTWMSRNVALHARKVADAIVEKSPVKKSTALISGSDRASTRAVSAAPPTLILGTSPGLTSRPPSPLTVWKPSPSIVRYLPKSPLPAAKADKSKAGRRKVWRKVVFRVC